WALPSETLGYSIRNCNLDELGATCGKVAPAARNLVEHNWRKRRNRWNGGLVADLGASHVDTAIMMGVTTSVDACIQHPRRHLWS
ncbi:MAG: hypothetical protein ACI9OJ_004127, partial [Myxococcota bacterium]